ncbi:uncharacterized protein PG998_010980 [Apiospora kogelbergensis]|uniref:uncharacterized protein n=1 Tax=Apiospora kogelbergensis TaxID=1337665 RepID=UPI0031323D8A
MHTPASTPFVRLGTAGPGAAWCHVRRASSSRLKVSPPYSMLHYNCLVLGSLALSYNRPPLSPPRVALFGNPHLDLPSSSSSSSSSSSPPPPPPPSPPPPASMYGSAIIAPSVQCPSLAVWFWPARKLCPQPRLLRSQTHQGVSSGGRDGPISYHVTSHPPSPYRVNRIASLCRAGLGCLLEAKENPLGSPCSVDARIQPLASNPRPSFAAIGALVRLTKFPFTYTVHPIQHIKQWDASTNIRSTLNTYYVLVSEPSEIQARGESLFGQNSLAWRLQKGYPYGEHTFGTRARGGRHEPVDRPRAGLYKNGHWARWGTLGDPSTGLEVPSPHFFPTPESYDMTIAGYFPMSLARHAASSGSICTVCSPLALLPPKVADLVQSIKADIS